MSSSEDMLFFYQKCSSSYIRFFSGKEADVIILFVRTGNHIGFWNDYRRLNVGLTRA